MIKNILRIVFLLLTITTCVIIFSYSAQDGTKSKSTSEKVARQIIETYPKTKKLQKEEKEQLVKKNQKLIRKTAHVAEYAILGFFLLGFIGTYDMETKTKLLIVLSFCIIFATSDEIHQGIVGGGRAMRMSDVLLDTAGSILGIVPMTLIQFFIHKKQAKKC